jgi:hypothetical protein
MIRRLRMRGVFVRRICMLLRYQEIVDELSLGGEDDIPELNLKACKIEPEL